MTCKSQIMDLLLFVTQCNCYLFKDNISANLWLGFQTTINYIDQLRHCTHVATNVSIFLRSCD